MVSVPPTSPDQHPCRILSLDGGGAKGFYTLGVLKQIEALVKRPIYECFDLIFGTSTGGIIASLLALGYAVDDVHGLYKQHVPNIMRKLTRAQKSAALAHLATTVFGTRTFEDVKTGVGIVATHWDLEKPMIFKTSVAQAHGRHNTFVPGFGCTIGEAVRASCSAYPFFEKTTVTISDGTKITLIDGGYCANNPTLYAIADAVMALKRSPADLRVVSVGVGNYPEPRHWKPKRWPSWLIKRLRSVQLLQKTLNVNTVSMEQLRAILFKNISAVRIDDTFTKPELATDLMEHNLKKLNSLYQHGGESFAKHETALKTLLLGGAQETNG